MYNINTITIDQVRDLIRNGDDSHHNQIRIRNNGEIFLSQDVGADNLSGIRGRFESFDAGNGFIGLSASQDEKFVKRIFTALQDWKDSPVSYIDQF